MKKVLVMILCAVCSFSMVYAQDTKNKKEKNKETVTFLVDGMDCANCVKKVEGNIAFEKGVTDLKCDLPTRTVTVTYRSDKTDEAKLATAFTKIKMEATPVEEGAEMEEHEGHQH